MQLSALFPLHCDDVAIAHIFLSLCRRWTSPPLRARMTVPSAEPHCRLDNLTEATSPAWQWLWYRLGDGAYRRAENRFLADLAGADAAYLWPMTSLRVFEGVRAAGKPLVLERFNCWQVRIKRLLDDAYARLGIAPQHGLTAQRLQAERRKLAMADLVVCPSPEVYASFREAGVDEDRLLRCSYGWSPQRFPDRTPQRADTDALTVLFVGKVCVRKGAHLLLRAWADADVAGRLVLCGEMEPAIADTCRELLARPDVEHVDHVADVGPQFRTADVFAFPSLEEGGPLVTYEAIAHGLPVLTTAVGAGAAVRDGIEGAVLDAYDEDAWVECLRRLARDPDLRARQGAAARARADEFTWDRVARRRARQLVRALGDRVAAVGRA